MKELQAIVFKFKQYKYYQEEEQPNKKKIAKVKIDYVILMMIVVK